MAPEADPAGDGDGEQDERESDNKEVEKDKVEKDKVIAAWSGLRKTSDGVSDKSHAILDELAVFLNAHPEFRLIQINVHTDDRGNPKARSQARADAVKSYLVSKGVSPTRIEAKGWGDSKPVAVNLTAAGRAKNNRASISVKEHGG